MTTWISISVLPFALDSDEMSTGGDSSEAEASLNVHVALESLCTQSTPCSLLMIYAMESVHTLSLLVIYFEYAQ